MLRYDTNADQDSLPGTTHDLIYSPHGTMQNAMSAARNQNRNPNKQSYKMSEEAKFWQQRFLGCCENAGRKGGSEDGQSVSVCTVKRDECADEHTCALCSRRQARLCARFVSFRFSGVLGHYLFLN